MPAPKAIFKEWEGHSKTYGVPHLKEKYDRISLHPTKDDVSNYSKEQLLGKISYDQIGLAIHLLENDKKWEGSGKFDFIESDFGIDLDLDAGGSVQDFKARYNSMPEADLYKYYAIQSGTNCISDRGELIYSNIYDLLKFGVVDAFVGGGGSRREKGVYTVIKLLEFKFNTTLGFPKKKCNQQGIYACNCTEQAKAWMQFLEDKKLIDKEEFVPVSISSDN